MKEIDRSDCFAYIDKNNCNALTKKNCKGCKFCKLRCEIKNNPFYAFSYKTPAEHKKDMLRHKVDPIDVVY